MGKIEYSSPPAEKEADDWQMEEKVPPKKKTRKQRKELSNADLKTYQFQDENNKKNRWFSKTIIWLIGAVLAELLASAILAYF